MAKTVKKLILPPALGSYAFLFKPRDPIEGSPPGAKPKYSIVLIWPKKEKEKLKALSDAITEVAKASFGVNKEGQTVNVVELLKTGRLKNPLRDGDIDRATDKVFQDSYFLTASSERQPGIVDKNVQRIFEDTEAYSGCTYRASVALFGFDRAGNKGVAVGLNNLQVVSKGPRLDGRKPPEDDFAGYSEEGATPAPEAKGGASGVDDLLG